LICSRSPPLLRQSFAHVRRRSWAPNRSIPISLAFDVRLDKGPVLPLSPDQARHLDHGYAVESIRAGSPGRVLFTQEAAASEREIAALAGNGREVNIYTSDGTPVQKQEAQTQTQSQALPNTMAQAPATLPQQPQMDTPAIAATPQTPEPVVRIRMGR